MESPSPSSYVDYYKSRTWCCCCCYKTSSSPPWYTCTKPKSRIKKQSICCICSSDTCIYILSSSEKARWQTAPPGRSSQCASRHPVNRVRYFWLPVFQYWTAWKSGPVLVKHSHEAPYTDCRTHPPSLLFACCIHQKLLMASLQRGVGHVRKQQQQPWTQPRAAAKEILHVLHLVA